METTPCRSRTVTGLSGQDPAGILKSEKPTADVLGKAGTHAAVQGSPSSLGSSQRASQAALCDRASRMAEKSQVSGQNICPATAARAVQPSPYPISRLGCDSRGCSSSCKSIFTLRGVRVEPVPVPRVPTGGISGVQQCQTSTFGRCLLKLPVLQGESKEQAGQGAK